VLIEDGRLAHELVERADRVPDVGVLGDDPQRQLLARAADPDRRVRSLQGLRVRHRVRERVEVVEAPEVIAAGLVGNAPHGALVLDGAVLR